MKKLIAITVALLFVLSLSACGADKDDNQNSNAEQTESVVSTDNQESSENSEETASNRLSELGKTKGFEITMEINDASQGNEAAITYGRKGDVVWLITNNESGNAFAQPEAGTVSMYEYSDGKWEATTTMASDNFEDAAKIYTTVADMYLFRVDSSSEEVKKDGSDTVAGRKCTKYKYEASALTVKAEAKASIDNETGVVLKYDYTLDSGDESGSTHMVVTSFKIGDEVKLPDFPEAGEDYMDMTGARGWVENSYTALIPKAPGTVAISTVSDNTFTAGMNNVTKDDAKKYISDCQAKGFKGEVDEEGSFTGTDAAGNELSISLMESDGQSQLLIILTKAAA